jgi:hypothetical protein
VHPVSEFLMQLFHDFPRYLPVQIVDVRYETNNFDIDEIQLFEFENFLILDLILVVESLKEMGFNDDDGNISRLVVAHSGQIEKILDVIQKCGAACRNTSNSE